MQPFDDKRCAICQREFADLETEDVRFRRDGALMHVECGERRLFVYGTLRQGGALSAWLDDLPVVREPAVLDGYALHYARAHRSFPYLVRNRHATTAGELVTFFIEDGYERLDQLCQMERNAGYEVERVSVKSDKGGSKPLDADAFVWTHKHYVGDRIDGDDWRLTPEYQRSRVEDVTPAEDDRPVLYLRTGGHPFISVESASGTVVWEGSSFSALTKWAKENDVQLERTAQ